jgi:hypothetical protein
MSKTTTLNQPVAHSAKMQLTVYKELLERLSVST